MNSVQPDISIVVPVYNEEDVLIKFSEHLIHNLITLNISWEILFIDDGSTDETFSMIETLAVSDDRIFGLQFSRNFGKEAAMMAGLEHANGRAVLIMDGDGQHPPEIIRSLVEPWHQGKADIVRAVKQTRGSENIFSKTNAWVFNSIMEWATGMDMTGASDFQLLDRRVVQNILQMKEKNRFFRGLSSWTGFRAEKIPFHVDERIGGKSKWNNLRLLKLAVTGITSFSAKPLNLAVDMGILGIAVSIILVIQALWSWLTGIAISGWTSLTIVILFFGSANLITVGLVGIYLAKIYEEVKARPLYLIQKKTRISDIPG
ncbi:MAG: glycosyltransferase family 2 protein [Desulfobacteraceae bacterium]|nr:glycosyltransferase family 2 protein [Desulfobacteraceae bacterium]